MNPAIMAFVATYGMKAAKFLADEVIVPKTIRSVGKEEWDSYTIDEKILACGKEVMTIGGKVKVPEMFKKTDEGKPSDKE